MEKIRVYIEETVTRCYEINANKELSDYCNTQKKTIDEVDVNDITSDIVSDGLVDYLLTQKNLISEVIEDRKYKTELGGIESCWMS